MKYVTFKVENEHPAYLLPERSICEERLLWQEQNTPCSMLHIFLNAPYMKKITSKLNNTISAHTHQSMNLNPKGLQEMLCRVSGDLPEIAGHKPSITRRRELFPQPLSPVTNRFTPATIFKLRSAANQRVHTEVYWGLFGLYLLIL